MPDNADSSALALVQDSQLCSRNTQTNSSERSDGGCGGSACPLGCKSQQKYGETSDTDNSGDKSMLTKTSHTLLQSTAAQPHTDAGMADDLP